MIVVIHHDSKEKGARNLIAVLLIFAVLAVMTYMTGTLALAILQSLYRRWRKIPSAAQTGSNLQADSTLRIDSTSMTDGVSHVDWIETCMAGVTLLCVYAEFYSLFAGVGALSLVAVIAVCTAGFALLKIRDHNAGRIIPSINVPVVVLILLLFSVGTARGYMHFDSDLYHAQSIHWIETYGVVKGLANLHNRLGYNSALFPLSALFSFHWLPWAGGQSFHAVNGFLAALLCMECLKTFRLSKGGPAVNENEFAGTEPADFIRLAGLYYLFSAFDEIVAPSSDCTMVILTFYIVIRYVSCLSLMSRTGSTGGRGGPGGSGSSNGASDGYDGTFELALLSLLCVFNISVKLSAAGLVLFAVLPAWNMLKKKEFSNILLFLCTGFLIIAPYLLRNVILSGYLVYPFPSVDVFDFDWKVPYGAALSDAREIRAWGKGLMDVAMAEAPLKVWWSAWWNSLAKIDKLLFAASAVLFLPAAGACVKKRTGDRPGKEPFTREQLKTEDQDKGHIAKAHLPEGLQAKSHLMEGLQTKAHLEIKDLGVLLTLGIAFWFWFHNAPLIRYGCVFVYCLAAYEAALLCFWAKDALRIPDRTAAVLLLVFMTLFMIYKTAVTGQEQLRMDMRPYLLRQQDYGQYEVQHYTIGNIAILCPTQGNQCGYSAFPSSPTDRSGVIEPRGTRLEDGFRARQGEDK